MSNKLASLAIELSANITKFESDMGRAARIAKRDSERMKKQVSAAMKAIGASAIAAGAGLAVLVKSTANTADAIQKMSDRLGVSTEFLSQYRHVAELSGTSLDRVGDGIRKMSKSVNDANNGLSTATRAFESLGISLDQLNSLNPEAQFELIADRMSKVESQSVKAGAAMDIFGRSGVDLLTVMNAGADGIKKMRDEADAFGGTISQNAADAAAHFNDELTRLSNQFKFMGEDIARDLMPEITKMITEFRKSDFVLNFADNVKELIKTIGGLVDEAVTLAKVLGTLFIVNKLASVFRLYGGVVLGLGKSFTLSSKAIAGYTLQLGIMQKAMIATRGIASGLLAVIGGPAGLAIFGGYAVWKGISAEVEARAERIAELSKVSDEAAAAMDRFMNAAGGSNAETAALKTMGDELDSINAKLKELRAEQGKHLAGAEFGYGSVKGGASLQRIQDEIDALEKQKQTIESMALLGGKLKPVYEAIGKVGQAWDELLPKANKMQAAYDSQVQSVTDWLKNTDKALEALEKENDYYGLSAVAIAKAEGERQKVIATSKKQRDEIDRVTKAYIEQIKRQEAQVKATEAQIAAQEALARLNSDYANLVQSLETPMETLNRTFIENAKVIGEMMAANQGNDKAMEDFRETLRRLNQQYKESEAEIKAATDATDEFRVALENLGVPSHVLQQLQQVAALMGSITNSGGFGGIFTGNFTSSLTGIFDQLPKVLQQAIEKADIEVSPSSDFTRMFEGLFAGGQESFRSAADMASLAQFAFDAWNRTEGQDDAGRVASTAADLAATGAFGPIAQAIGQIAQSLNAITGGRLFGTAYELTGSGFSGGVGLGGVSGSQYTESQRERSFFRGTQTRIDTSELDSQIREVLQKIQDAAEQIAAASAQALGVDVPNLVSGSIEQEFDADGNLVSSISTVLGRTFNEGIEEFGMRVSAENIIASLNQAFDPIIVQYDQVVQMFDDYGRVIGSFTRTANALVNEADFIANRWRMDAETFLDGAQMLLAAGTDIVNGVGLFDTLTEVADTIEAMQKPNETLLDAYSRISEATSQLTDALGVMGLSLDNSRQEFVQFAADISEAAGGVERSQALWQAYFDTFYTAEELAQNALDNAVTNRDSELADIGLDASVTQEQFRQLFEDTLPNLSADMVVEWLEAAEAIGIVIDAEAQLAQIRGQNADELAEMMAEIGSDIEDMNLSPFAKRLKDIKDAFNEQIATAKELGATERELAMIQTYASRQIQQAIQMLESDIRGALTELYGTELDQINEQIALLEQEGSMIQNIGQANQNRYQDELRAIQNIQGYLDSLLLDETLSTLNPMEQLQEAQSQFEEMLAMAQGGDIDALNALPGLANTLLGFGRDVWASGQQYTDLFDMVTGALSGLGVTSSPGGDNTGSIMVGQNAELIALQQRANELTEQQTANQNFDAAWAIAEQIGQLSSVTNDSFAELAERLGLPVEQFLTDLGVDLENITVETSTALANVAATMGVEITELADAVGISLGNLADDQSLLNDALEATIMGLPQGIADDLDAMLTAIEKSTDPEEREAILAEMEEYISTLPADQANLLAPFFDNIDPTTNASQQLDRMTQLNETNQSIDSELKAMRLEQQQQSAEANTGQDAEIRELKDLNRNIIRLMDIVGVA